MGTSTIMNDAQLVKWNGSLYFSDMVDNNFVLRLVNPNQKQAYGFFGTEIAWDKTQWYDPNYQTPPIGPPLRPF